MVSGAHAIRQDLVHEHGVGFMNADDRSLADDIFDTGGESPPRTPLSRTVAGGFVAFGAGLVASAWLWDWRWAATGLVVLLGAAVISAVVTPQQQRR